MHRISVTSSSIVRIGHEGETLEVEFHSGRCPAKGASGVCDCAVTAEGAVYAHDGVPENLFRALLQSPSVGRLYGQAVRGKFAGRKIREGVKADGPEAPPPMTVAAEAERFDYVGQVVALSAHIPLGGLIVPIAAPASGGFTLGRIEAETEGSGTLSIGAIVDGEHRAAFLRAEFADAGPRLVRGTPICYGDTIALYFQAGGAVKLVRAVAFVRSSALLP